MIVEGPGGTLTTGFSGSGCVDVGPIRPRDLTGQATNGRIGPTWYQGAAVGRVGQRPNLRIRTWRAGARGGPVRAR
jgi:hypothetical protein